MTSRPLISGCSILTGNDKSSLSVLGLCWDVSTISDSTFPRGYSALFAAKTRLFPWKSGMVRCLVRNMLAILRTAQPQGVVWKETGNGVEEDLMSNLRSTENAEACALISLGIV